MKKVVSMILALVMIFNIFITNANSGLVYANNNDSVQKLNSEEVTTEQKELGEEPKDTIEEKANLLTEESKDNLLQDTNQEKIGDKKEQSLEESKRIQSFKEESGLSIKVDAPKGAFLSGTTASITPISRDKNKISYDITFRDANKREVQPENGKSVEVSFTVDKTSSLILNKGFVSLKLYHIVDGVSREIDSKVTLGERVTLSAKVNHFSEFQVVAEENIDLSLVKNAVESVKVGENKKVDVDITKFEIQHVNQTTAQNIYWTDTFLLMMNWDASKNGTNLHEGDYFDVKLPDEMKFPSDTTARDFELKNSEGIVVANAHVTPGPDDTGGTIRVTFTKTVENKYNVKGTMYLAAKFNKDKITLNQSNTFTITVGSQVLTDNVNISGPSELQNDYLGKWGGKLNGNPKEVVWHVRINHAGDELSTVVIKDDFSKTGEKLVDKSFVLKKVEFTKYGDILKVIEDNIDLTSKLQVSPDKNSFTLTLGDLGKDDRYYLGYRTTYTPGTTLKNELDLISVQQQKHIVASYRSAESGGTGDGDLASKIKLIKVDEENTKTKLANAVFEVTKPNGEKFELKTGENGEVISGILEQGEYKVKEKIAPIGYELNEEEYTLKVTPTGGAIQTITNKPIKRDVAVKKLWGGIQLESCTVKLYADDKEIDSIVLNKDKEWKHTFTNLRKFNSEGKEIKYSVKEEVPKGYKAEYHGDMEKGFSIINTPDVTDITATKKWEGGPSEKPTVWFKLYRNIEGEEAKPVEGLFEQPLHNGDTSVTWRGLPKTNDEGKEYIYSVKEGELKDGVFTEKAPKNYIKTENGLTVTNKYCSPKIDITGKKIWENEGEKPTIKLQLFKNGQAEGNPVELKDGKTEHTWKNLPKTDKDGKDYEYTVKEVDEVNGHIKIGNTWYKVTYEGNTQTGFTIKNKKLPPLTPTTTESTTTASTTSRPTTTETPTTSSTTSRPTTTESTTTSSTTSRPTTTESMTTTSATSSPTTSRPTTTESTTTSSTTSSPTTTETPTTSSTTSSPTTTESMTTTSMTSHPTTMVSTVTSSTVLPRVTTTVRKPNLPKTGSSTNPWFVVAGMSVLVLTGGFLFVSRKEKN
ncbi:Cna B-type domain-containing protein [Streptococcus ovis]|uniref:Cna B-type domain-containing protein n=1 Tax=Streptococcus ovis TaxID=82806 RepID=UPI00037E2115|nr:Cna B-type domain-containing protein [Streptococcus ovis]